jgi:hypothetical protein
MDSLEVTLQRSKCVPQKNVYIYLGIQEERGTMFQEKQRVENSQSDSRNSTVVCLPSQTGYSWAGNYAKGFAGLSNICLYINA